MMVWAYCVVFLAAYISSDIYKRNVNCVVIKKAIFLRNVNELLHTTVAVFGLALWGSGVDSSVDSYSGAGFALRGLLTFI